MLQNTIRKRESNRRACMRWLAWLEWPFATHPRLFFDDGVYPRKYVWEGAYWQVPEYHRALSRDGFWEDREGSQAVMLDRIQQGHRYKTRQEIVTYIPIEAEDWLCNTETQRYENVYTRKSEAEKPLLHTVTS